VPFVSIEAARRILAGGEAPGSFRADGTGLKGFDCVVYGDSENLLVEIKGRRILPRKGRSRATKQASSNEGETPVSLGEPPPPGRMECWTTLADLASLRQWEQRFGPPFIAAIVFVYWCEGEPPGALYQEVFEFRKRWYALRAVRVQHYMSAMRVRSPKWGTVDLSPDDFARLSQPFAPTAHFPLRRGASVDVGANVFARAREGPAFPQS
jgi:hypothetical protein